MTTETDLLDAVPFQQNAEEVLARFTKWAEVMGATKVNKSVPGHERKRLIGPEDAQCVLALETNGYGRPTGVTLDPPYVGYGYGQRVRKRTYKFPVSAQKVKAAAAQIAGEVQTINAEKEKERALWNAATQAREMGEKKITEALLGLGLKPGYSERGHWSAQDGGRVKFEATLEVDDAIELAKLIAPFLKGEK